MTKRGHYADYPRESNVTAEAALLTAWASLHRYHESLVLVGGLALKYLTVSASGLLPGPVTLDADFGVGIGTEGGQYGTIRDDLFLPRGSCWNAADLSAKPDRHRSTSIF